LDSDSKHAIYAAFAFAGVVIIFGIAYYILVRGRRNRKLPSQNKVIDIFQLNEKKV